MRADCRGPPRFTTDTAARTGRSERAVQRDAERGERVSNEALALLRGTPLDTGCYLDSLKRLGMAEIDVRLAELDELDRVIAECDENLCGTRLSPAEIARFTAERKRAYVAKHGETAHGGDRKSSRQVGDLIDTPRFTADTAARTGRSERAVQRDAERGERVCDEALALLRGTPLDTGRYLDSLKRLAPADQIARDSGKRRLPGAGRGASDENLCGTRFTADTAARTGRSECSVQRDAERGKRVSDEALALLRGTPVDIGRLRPSWLRGCRRPALGASHQPHTWPAAVGVEEFDAGGFEGCADRRNGAGVGLTLAQLKGRNRSLRYPGSRNKIVL